MNRFSSTTIRAFVVVGFAMISIHAAGISTSRSNLRTKNNSTVVQDSTNPGQDDSSASAMRRDVDSKGRPSSGVTSSAMIECPPGTVPSGSAGCVPVTSATATIKGGNRPALVQDEPVLDAQSTKSGSTDTNGAASSTVENFNHRQDFGQVKADKK